jgi:hypothetical protein
MVCSISMCRIIPAAQRLGAAYKTLQSRTSPPINMTVLVPWWAVCCGLWDGRGTLAHTAKVYMPSDKTPVRSTRMPPVGGVHACVLAHLGGQSCVGCGTGGNLAVRSMLSPYQFSTYRSHHVKAAWGKRGKGNVEAGHMDLADEEDGEANDHSAGDTCEQNALDEAAHHT